MSCRYTAFVVPFHGWVGGAATGKIADSLHRTVLVSALEPVHMDLIYICKQEALLQKSLPFHFCNYSLGMLEANKEEENNWLFRSCAGTLPNARSQQQCLVLPCSPMNVQSCTTPLPSF